MHLQVYRCFDIPRAGYRTSILLCRVVPIQIPVLQNLSNTAESAGISIIKYISLCTDPIPCCLLAAEQYPATSQLA